ncbi:MAG: sugar phosphate isomerase/epimerase family protein [Sphingomonadaceae bacterium]|nr:sugar phosphate isomerase/epimerase family protein [Sphingomonadaceae bacterium]
MNRLRFAYNTNGCSNHRLDDALELIAEAGFDGVALTLDWHHLDPFAPGWNVAAARLRRRLGELGLGVVIETGARYLLDPRHKHEPTLLHPTPEGRARRRAFLKRAADIAAQVEAEAVSFWAGVPQPGVARGDAEGWLHEGLADVLAYADGLGVTMAFEPEPGMLIETVAEYAALAEHHPALMLALDTGHCLVTGDIEPEDAVRAYAGRLGTVAIEGMRRGDHTHLPLDEGDMDLPAVLRALAEVGFSGLVCVELSRESPRAHAAIPQAIEQIRAALARGPLPRPGEVAGQGNAGGGAAAAPMQPPALRATSPARGVGPGA